MLDGAFKSPLQGVSQQAPRDRLDGQCVSQVNLIADPVKVLTRRPPLEYLNKVDIDDSYKWLNFKFQDTLYYLFHKIGSVKLYDIMADTELTLSGSVPSYIGNNMCVASIDDDVIMCNQDVTVEMDNFTEQSCPQTRIVYSRGGVTTYTYSITVDSTTVSYSPNNAANASGSNIINELYTQLIAESAVTNLYNVSRRDNVLMIRCKNVANPAPVVAVSDGGTGKDLILVRSEINDIGELPPFAYDGMFITVRSDRRSEYDDYYLMYVAEGGAAFTLQPGFWVENAKPGEKHFFDDSTMPHKLTINKSAGTFTIQEGEYAPRRAGSVLTNPTPSFVGKSINNLSTFQGRLVILTDAVFMSRTNNPLFCFRQTVTTLTDTDPIDIKSSIESPERLNSGIQFNRNFLAYGDSVQFAVLGETKLTPETAALPVLSNFSASRVRPVPTGLSVMHAYPFGDFSGMYEIFPTTIQDRVQYDKITAHVSNYIEGQVKHMAGATNFDSVYVLADNPDTIYVYKYLYSGEQKVQSAWSKWVFDFDILDFFISVDTMYILYKFNGDFCLGTIRLDYPEEEGLIYSIYLDNKVYVDVEDGTFLSPYKLDLAKDVLIMLDDQEGVQNPITNFNDDTLEGQLNINYTGKAVLGRKTYFEYIPNIPLIKDENGKVIGTGIFNILSYRATVRNTSTFFIDIINKKEELISTREYSSNRGGAGGDYQYDLLNLYTGIVKIPFHKNNQRFNIRFKDTSYVPFNLIDLEYTGRWFKAGKRI